jgi:hypothetical protein
MKKMSPDYRTKRPLSRLLLSSATAFALITLGVRQSHAQVVTEDPGLIAQIASTVTAMNAELQQVTAIAGTVSSVLNVQQDISGALGLIGQGIGDIGGGTVGDLIASAKMGFSAYQQAKNTAEQIIGEVHNLSTDPLGSLSLLTIFQAITNNSATSIFSTDQAIATQVQAMNNVMMGSLSVPAATQVIAQSMYIATPQPTADQIEAVNATRRAVVQNAAITSMTSAAAVNQNISDNGQDALQSLSQGVANSQDERGDIKANSAIVLKVAEQISGQNALLGQLLYLESANSMATQGVYGPNANNAQAPAAGNGTPGP